MVKKCLFIVSVAFSMFTYSKDLSFGVYTSDQSREMFKKFRPILNDLEKSTGKKIKLKVIRSYDKAILALSNGEVDFARFGPASYVLAKRKNPNIKILALELKKGKKRFKGHFVVHADSNLNSIDDLKKKKLSFAFGNPKSTIGRYLAQEYLLSRNITNKSLKDYKYLERHDLVASSVLRKKYDVGVIKSGTYKKYKDKGLKVIGSFDNITKPWVASAKLDSTVFNRLKGALMKLAKGDKSLKKLKISGFKEANDKEFSFIRRAMDKSEKF